jgi:flagellar biosynthesis GTPase FlhF
LKKVEFHYVSKTDWLNLEFLAELLLVSDLFKLFSAKEMKQYKKTLRQNQEAEILKAAGMSNEDSQAQPTQPKTYDPYHQVKESKTFAQFASPNDPEDSPNDSDSEDPEALAQELAQIKREMESVQNGTAMPEPEVENFTESEIQEKKADKKKRNRKKNKAPKQEEMIEEPQSPEEKVNFLEHDFHAELDKVEDPFDENVNCLATIKKNFNYNKELNSHFKGQKLVDGTDYGNFFLANPTRHAQ